MEEDNIDSRKKYWFDTCIWRDFYEDRFSRSGNPLGSYATNAFMKVIKNKSLIFYSDAIIYELKRNYDKEEICEMLNVLLVVGVLAWVDITDEEYLEAEEICALKGLPLADCLHAVQSRNCGAILVSQDKHIIDSLYGIVEVKRPQEL